MKKIFTFLLAAGFLSIMFTSITSCTTREYICQCVMTYEGAPGLPEPQVRQYAITDSKKNAERMCRENSDTFEEGGITTHEDCDLW